VNVAVIDAGIGNLGAIPNMFARLGARATVTRSPQAIAAADRIVLPGVGSFDAAMRSLTEVGILDRLRERVLGDGIPLLGVCLGMEILGDRSEEGELPGLGWIPGDVKRLDFDGLDHPPRVPHMGWNIVQATREVPLLRDLGERPRFYFAHSFYFRPRDERDVIAVTDYGRRIVSAVQRGNVMGVQFHPEKSHRFGLALLRNFLDS
jgi:glutamine amidotransferase